MSPCSLSRCTRSATTLLSIILIGAGCLTSGSQPNTTDSTTDTVIDRTLHADEIDPGIYFDKHSKSDPFRETYAAFRERRAKDVLDPTQPRPRKTRPAEYRTSDMPWTPLTEALPWDWEGVDRAAPDAARGLRESVRIRRAFDMPDFEILQILLGPGAILPGHAEAAPGGYHVIEGSGRITVEGESATVAPGISVKLDAYDVRRIEADASGPLKLLWFRWAPGGDQSYMASGYYLTGANQHVQPVEANLPDKIDFFGERYSYELVAETGSNSTQVASDECDYCQTAERSAAASANSAGVYPTTPRWRQESDVAWLRLDQLPPGSGFFWTKDVGAVLPLAQRVSEVFRIKSFFRAVIPDVGYDFNVSYAVWGPWARYVEHSHATPEFYYIMSGPVEHWVNGVKHRAVPGNVYLHNSYVPHESRGITEGVRYEVITGSWPPNGDRSVFDQPFFLVEPLPEQPSEAVLKADAPFHP